MEDYFGRQVGDVADEVDDRSTHREAAVIFIVLKAKIRPEKRNEWLVGIKQYTADVRQEPGNVSFDYYENSESPNEFVIVEAFADSDAGSAHVATEHAQNFFPFMSRVISEKPKINYQELTGEAWSEMAEVSPE
ncbi:MAG TPA: putative quinol monooxygenase [Pseudonocardia sp.]|uniref:putative quinol monooxygenase n=1 Tax=Pseudonocardia sp. TaxID=60912 RepID=UPI002BC04599|nr:putative quinol monooxygenase [Pseudonocardia sp.]HTF53741.1 putative quinol monooxygenase [Pseudonocardia sp.]